MIGKIVLTLTISVTTQTRSTMAACSNATATAGKRQLAGQAEPAGRISRALASAGLGVCIAARRGRLAALRRCYHDNITSIGRHDNSTNMARQPRHTLHDLASCLPGNQPSQLACRRRCHVSCFE